MLRNHRTDLLAFVEVLQEELAQEIIVTENGVPHKVTKQRAMVKSLLALALKGGDPLIVEEPIHRGRVW